MKQPTFTSLLLVVTAVSLLSGISSYLWKEREVRHRMYVEESLLRTSRAKFLAEKELEMQKGRTAALERQLVGMQRANRFTLARLRGLERKFTNFREEFTRMENSKRSLESKLDAFRSQRHPASSGTNRAQEVDLGQIMVSASPNLEGKVIAVNRPFQFVVIDLGGEHNLPVGAVLSIYRQSDFIGRIQVEEVRESVAACRILTEWTRREIKENDLVKEL